MGEKRDVAGIIRHHRAAQLADAAMCRNRDRVCELLAQHADPNYQDKIGRLALHAAAFSGSAEVVQDILEANADANLAETDREGDKPLQIAAWQGHTEVTRLLLRFSADIDMADGRGWTPLCSAARQGHTATVKALIRGGAEVGKAAVVAGEGTLTPFQAAARGRHSDVAQVLKEALTNAGTSSSPLQVGRRIFRQSRGGLIFASSRWRGFLGKCACMCSPSS